MIVAEIDWVAVGAVAGGIAAIVGIPTAVFAAVTAIAAKNQAESAEQEADAAMRMAKLAEDEQERATVPLLRIGRWPNGSAMFQLNGPSGDWRQQTPIVYVQNLRDVPAEIVGASLNDHPPQIAKATAEKEHPAIVEFPIDSIRPYGDERGGPHRFTAEFHVPDSGKRGTFTASVWLQGGQWNAGGERQELDD